MAPIRGKSCGACTAPLELNGENWKDAKLDALFAVQIIAAFVILLCMVLSFTFKSLKGIRAGTYFGAAFWAFAYFFLNEITIGLPESQARTTRLYYLNYIFEDLAWRISDLVVLIVIFQTISHTSTTGLALRLPVFSTAAFVLLGVLSAASCGMYAFEIFAFIAEQDFESSFYNVSIQKENVELAYDALYFVASVFAALSAFYVTVREHSKTAVIMALVVVPSLLLRSVLDLAIEATGVAQLHFMPTNSKDVYNLEWTSRFIYCFTAMSIFLGLAVIGVAGSNTRRQQKRIGYN